MPLITVKTVIQRNLIIENTNKKPGSGFTKQPLNKDWAGKVALAFKNNPELSIRDVAKRYDMSKSSVLYKKFKIPNRNQTTNAKAKTRARNLR